MEDLNKVIPSDGVEVKVGSETFRVKPLGVRRLTRDVVPNLGLLLMVYAGVEDKSLDLFDALELGGEALYRLLGNAIGKPIEFFDDAPPDDTVELLLTVLEVNGDFFARWLQEQSDKAETRKRFQALITRLLPAQAQATSLTTTSGN